MANQIYGDNFFGAIGSHKPVYIIVGDNLYAAHAIELTRSVSVNSLVETTLTASMYDASPIPEPDYERPMIHMRDGDKFVSYDEYEKLLMLFVKARIGGK